MVSISAVSNPVTQSAYNRSRPYRNELGNSVTNYYKDGNLYYTKEDIDLMSYKYDGIKREKSITGHQEIYRDKNNRAISNHIVKYEYPFEHYTRGSSTVGSIVTKQLDKPDYIQSSASNTTTRKSSQKTLNLHKVVSNIESLNDTYLYRYPENNAELKIIRKRLFDFGEKTYKNPFRTLTAVEYNVKDGNAVKSLIFDAESKVKDIQEILKTNIPQKMRVALNRLLKQIM